MLTTLFAELERRGAFTNGLSRAYTLGLADPENTPLVASASFYAEAVRTSTRLRLAHAVGERLSRAAAHDQAADDLTQIIANTATDLGHIPPPLDGAAAEKPATIADLFKVDLGENNWLVPGLIEHGERVVIVAAEGGGKSVLSTQWAIAIAGGVHPFTGQKVGDPKRVLLIDTENGPRQTQRRYEWVGKRFKNAEPGWAHRIQHHIRTEGLDLAKRDRAWLMKVAADCSPDLIIVGPAYKIMAGDPQRDSDVLALLSALDEVRVRHNAALFIETHTGHAKDGAGNRIVRPYGSSVWLRWPEVGIGMTRGPGDMGDKHVTEFAIGHWRGQREERDWPELIERGTPGQLPWNPVGTDYWTKATRKGIA
ncbi:MAG: AAA family ATPase ['Waltheria sp.' little leaf phytoplasma]|nr:AAA family ATPase ['Waltheria sp.' little leaf phytoplasma]